MALRHLWAPRHTAVRRTGIGGQEDENGRDNKIDEANHVGGQELSPQPHAMAIVQLDRGPSPHPCQDPRTTQARNVTQGATPTHSLKRMAEPRLKVKPGSPSRTISDGVTRAQVMHI
jgi:hypothetical protein